MKMELGIKIKINFRNGNYVWVGEYIASTALGN